MQRNKWSIEFPASVVGTAAEDRANHHRGRLSYWSGRKEKAAVRLREEGIEIDESDLSDYALTSNTPPRPRVNQAAWEEYQATCRKVYNHTEQSEEYARWARMLKIAGERGQSIILDAEDLEFFRM